MTIELTHTQPVISIETQISPENWEDSRAVKEAIDKVGGAQNVIDLICERFTTLGNDEQLYKCTKVWVQVTKTHAIASGKPERIPESITLEGAPEHPGQPYIKKPISQKLRWKVFERDDFTCQECGSRQLLEADHIYPESLGGETTMDNLQTLCKSCNARKGARV